VGRCRDGQDSAGEGGEPDQGGGGGAGEAGLDHLSSFSRSLVAGYVEKRIKPGPQWNINALVGLAADQERPATPEDDGPR
jgi:hypothetical protein